MSLLARTVAVLLAITFASQAVAQGRTVRICRYTGQVRSSCACPRAHAPEQRKAELKKAGCCEVRRSSPAPVAPAVGPAKHFELAKPIALCPASASPELPDLATVEQFFTAARQQAPPPERLYLSFRTLLI